MQASEHKVIIAGGGPTGLMLAAELALSGVETLVVERRTDQGLTGHRAGGLHARTLEIFDQRGIADRFIAEGQKVQATGFAGVRFDISQLPTRHPYTLGLWQTHIERILADWVAELGVRVMRGVEVTGLSQDEAGVDVMLSDGRSLRSDYLVGCDGGRSLVRKAAGIAFPGSAATISNIIGEIEVTTQPELGVHRTALGIHSFGRSDYRIVDGKIVYAETGPVTVLVTEPQAGASGPPTLDELKAALVAAVGTDYGAHSPLWLSRFTDAARQAAQYRQGRVLVAGDAAHIHPPDGGHGLQTGVGDAVNLGWKLAQVISGVSPDTLLDTYHAERQPVAARVLRHTLASVVMRGDDDRSKALRETMAELLGFDEARRHFAADSAELTIAYDFGPGHPLLGRRVPDLDLITETGALRLYELLREARWVLINFGAKGAFDYLQPDANVLRIIDARTDGPWELPAIGTVSAPDAVLVRPDGHVAWVGDGSRAGLDAALARWISP